MLFSLYVNTMISRLRDHGYGCHIGNLYIGCIMYADDLLLLSGSVITLQKMLDCCGLVGQEIELNFNCKKSQCMVIGPIKMQTPLPMNINDNIIQWTDKLKYLGISIVSGVKFTIDFSETRRKFFVSVNTILSKCKYSSDLVKLELMECYCLPILLYGLDCMNIKVPQLKEINSWWNCVYRRIFGFNQWESVKEVIFYLGRLDVHHLVNMRRLLFLKRSEICNNKVINECIYRYKRHNCELLEVQKLCNSDVNWSAPKIKALTHVAFKSAAS